MGAGWLQTLRAVSGHRKRNPAYPPENLKASLTKWPLPAHSAPWMPLTGKRFLVSQRAGTWNHPPCSIFSWI